MGGVKRHKVKPFVSIIDGQLKTGKTDRLSIAVDYEPQRTRAGVADTPLLIPVSINGKKRKTNFSKIEMEKYL